MENTITTFIRSAGNNQLSSRRVLFHLPKRLTGYSVSDANILQTNLAPVSVALCPTPFCARSCNFCSNAQRNKENRKKFLQLEPDRFTRLVDDLAEMKVQGVSIAGGGEPLIYKGPIIENLFLKKDLPFRIGIHTNGVALNRILFKEIFTDSNISYINVSVVAHNPSLYSKICRVPENQFFKIEKNIVDMLYLVESTGSSLLSGVKILLCRDNFHFAFEIFDYFRGLGVKNILIRCVGNFEPDQDVELFSGQINQLMRIFKNRLGMSEDQIAAVIGHKYGVDSLPIPSRCWICALQYTAGVDPDGEVYLCSPWSRKEYSIGNVNKSSIQNLWGSGRHKNVVEQLNLNLRSGKCTPLLCRHYYSNLAIDAFIAGELSSLPMANFEKGYGRFI